MIKIVSNAHPRIRSIIATYLYLPMVTNSVEGETKTIILKYIESIIEIKDSSPEFDLSLGHSVLLIPLPRQYANPKDKIKMIDNINV